MALVEKKVAVLIGAGMVAKTHVAACAAASAHLRLKGILSRGQERAELLAKQASESTQSHVITYDDINQVANDDEVDFVIMTTPPSVREELIEPLAKAGKPILLEKPIARNLKEATYLVELCKQYGVTLGIVFQHRARASSVMASQIIKQGELGDLGTLGTVDIDVPWWRDQDYYDEPGRGTYERDGGGVLINQAIHTIDLALSLTGPVRSVVAMSKTSLLHNMESEDFVVAGLEFDNGVVGSMRASTASFPGRPESISLQFERATVHLERGQCVVSFRDGKVERFGEPASTGGGADPMAFTHTWHQSIIENFVSVLSGDGQLFASGEQALAAHALIEATVRSARNGTTQRL